MSFAATATSRPDGVISGVPVGIFQPVTGGCGGSALGIKRGGSVTRKLDTGALITISRQRAVSLTSAFSVFRSGAGPYQFERTWKLSSPSLTFAPRETIA